MLLTGIFLNVLLSTGIVVLNITPSCPKGFYIRSFTEPHIGDYVVFENPRRDLNPCRTIMKKIINERSDGFAFVSGKTKLSLDSRIYGYLDKKTMKRYVPLIAEKEEKFYE